MHDEASPTSTWLCGCTSGAARRVGNGAQLRRNTALRRGQPSAPVPTSRTPENFCHRYQRLARGAGGARDEGRARSGPALSCRLISVRKLLRQSALALPREWCTAPRWQPHPQPQTPPRPSSWARLGRIPPLVAPRIPPGRAGAAPRCCARKRRPRFPEPCTGQAAASPKVRKGPGALRRGGSKQAWPLPARERGP
jgi:hypothetical protein